MNFRLKSCLIACFFILTLNLYSQAAGTGVVRGEVLDAQTAEPMFGVTVVIRALGKSTRTDLDGKYTLSGLPDGDHKVEFILQGMDTQSRTASVTGNKPVSVNIAMGVKKLDTVVVEGRALNDTDASLLKLQKKSATVSDGISAQAIQKTPDASAGDVVRRVTGITLVGGKFVFVRGLGERYSNTVFNGVPLPSPEPDKRVVPLDLFPAQMIKNIIVSKTFIPEESAEFSGGTVKIETKEFPDQFFVKVGVGGGYNNNTTFRNFKTYDSGPNQNVFGLGNVDKDAIGLDPGNRTKPGLVDAIPNTGFREGGQFTGGYSSDAISAGSQLFNNQWSPSTINAPINKAFNFSTGNTSKVFGERKLGYIFAVTYNNDFQYKEEKDRFYTVGPVANGIPTGGKNRSLTTFNDFNNKSWTESVNWGTMFNTTFEIKNGHRIHFKNFLSVNNDKEVRFYNGYTAKLPAEIAGQKLNYTMRNLFNTQIGGDHIIPIKDINTKLDWVFSYSEANRNQPDMRDNVYAAQPPYTLHQGTIPSLLLATSSGSRFFSTTNDSNKYAGFNYEVPFNQWNGLQSKLKVGYSALTRERSFEAEFFRFNQNTNGTARAVDGSPLPSNLLNYPVPPEVAFNPFFRGSRGMYIQEDTRATDRYSAKQKLHAYYSQVDMPVTSKLRFIGGGRYEDNFQSVLTYNPFDPFNTYLGKFDYKTYVHDDIMKYIDPTFRKTEAINSNRNYLPSANFVYSPNDKTNIRVAYTETVTRPDFRELSPFEFTDVLQGIPTKGNSGLKRTYIHNYDVRYEYYPKGDEFVAVGVFRKNMSSPIEKVTEVDQQLRYTYTNAKSAYVQGIEFEARKGLGFISSAMDRFHLGINTFFIKSEVTLNDWIFYQLGALGSSNTQQPTSLSRPLQGQSPYVYNINLEYKLDEKGNHTITALYNEFGKRINAVGGLGIPDTYDRPVGMLDLVYRLRFKERWDFKLSGKNLTDARIKTVQEDPWLGKDVTVHSYRLGPTFSFMLTYNFE